MSDSVGNHQWGNRWSKFRAEKTSKANLGLLVFQVGGAVAAQLFQVGSDLLFQQLLDFFHLFVLLGHGLVGSHLFGFKHARAGSLLNHGEDLVEEMEGEKEGENRAL